MFQDQQPTLTEVWTSLPITTPFVLLDFIPTLDGISQTILVEKLVVTLAVHAILICHDPLLKPAQTQILPQQDIESSIDGLSDFVSNEDDSVEAFKDHANFGC